MFECGLKSIIMATGFGGKKFIPVPLKAVKISCRLINFVTEVTIEQEYQNVEERPIECEYMFPIEEDSAVIQFTAQLEGKTLESTVKPNKDAEADYKTAVSEGRTGFIAQSVRPDILQIKVGHLSPGARCTIKLTYIAEACLEGDSIRLTIPTTISPKYTPFVGPFSVEAKKIASIKYDFNTPAPMTFSLTAEMKTKILGITSPSHSFSSVEMDNTANEGLYTSKTKLTSTTSDLDRDIVILVKCESANKSVVLREDGQESTVLMVSLVPKLELKSDPKLDIVFLVDCSGSMQGSSIKMARDAISILIHSLPHSTHFNIVRFGCSYQKLFPTSVPYCECTLAYAKQAIQNIEANLGGTEILTPLKMLLEEKTCVPRRVFVLTDGSVSNSMACLKLAQKHNGTNKVFALGIGSAADRHLVKGLARAGLGTSEFTTEGEMIAPKVIKQLKHCLQPNLKDVNIDWGFTNQAYSQAPMKVPSLYNGSRLQIFRTIANNSKIPDKINISARMDDGESGENEIYEEVVEVDESTLEGNLIHKMFARKMIQDLEEIEELEDKKEVEEIITELAIKYQLMSKYTSMVAVDTEENKNSLPMQTRSVGNQYPRGFGAPQGQPSPAFSFGVAQSSPATGFSFGAAQSSPVSFGAAQSSPASFGAAQSSSASFGAAQSSWASFGAAQSSSATGFSFGAAMASPVTAQQTPSAFGAAQTSTGFGFGAAQSSTATGFSFGAAKASPVGFSQTGAANASPGSFGAAQPTPSAFGAPNSAQPSTGFSFGAAQSSSVGVSQTGAANASSGLFGSAKPTPPGFGAANASPGLFGAAQPTASGFGATNPTPFGSFGASQTQTIGLFGSSNSNANTFGAGTVENKSDYKNDTPMERVLALIALQTAEGYFNKEKDIFTALNINEAEVEKVFNEENVDAKLFYTLLVIVALKKKFPELKPCWELVAEKAKAFLQKKNYPVEAKENILNLITQ